MKSKITGLFGVLLLVVAFCLSQAGNNSESFIDL